MILFLFVINSIAISNSSIQFYSHVIGTYRGKLLLTLLILYTAYLITLLQSLQNVYNLVVLDINNELNILTTNFHTKFPLN